MKNINFINQSQSIIIVKNSSETINYKYKINKIAATCLFFALLPLVAISGSSVPLFMVDKSNSKNNNLPVDERHLMLMMKYQKCNIQKPTDIQTVYFNNDNFFPSHHKSIYGNKLSSGNNSSQTPYFTINLNTIPEFTYDDNLSHNKWSLHIVTTLRINNPVSFTKIWESKCKTNYKISSIHDIFNNNCSALSNNYNLHAQHCFKILNEKLSSDMSVNSE